MTDSHDYWTIVWKQFRQHPLGQVALFIVLLFALVGIYAPFLASSKPLVVYFDGHWYFPLFRYLFYRGFFTKQLDLFYNLLMFTLPIMIIGWKLTRKAPHRRLLVLGLILAIHLILFLYFANRIPVDPASSPKLNHERHRKIQEALADQRLDPIFYTPFLLDWNEELHYLTPYAQLNLVLNEQQTKKQHEKLLPYEEAYIQATERRGQPATSIPTVWSLQHRHEQEAIKQLHQTLVDSQSNYLQAKKILDTLQSLCNQASLPPWLTCSFLSYLSPHDKEELIQAKQTVVSYERTQAELTYLKERQLWLETKVSQLHYEVMPLIRPYHWEDDAGGDQLLNQYVNWWNLTRINRKDMVASLIFGVRISLSVGLLAVSLALSIGIPIGAMAGYYGGKIDIITYRLIEIWESMPTFFMLLMIVAFFQNKSVFLVISVIGLFGWTNFSRFVRGEFFKQKQLPYVEACHALGFNNRYIMFSHLLPNAIPPLLTLVPFAMMSAITSEAGLSFLGLGEEGSCSWGVLMDEGRTAFPSESYLLWPPAILLTILLVAIALVGDALRDALDPKMHS